MDEEGSKLDLRLYWEVLKRRWHIIALIFVIGAVGAYLYAKRQTPIYQGVTQVEVQSFGSSNSSVINPLADATLSLQSDVQVIESDAVLSRAAQSLNLPSSKPLRAAVSVGLVPNTQILEIRTVSPNPSTAARWANAVAAAFLSFQRDQALTSVTAATTDIEARVDEIRKEIAAAGTSPVSSSAISSYNAQIVALEAGLNALPGSQALASGGGSIIVAATRPAAPISPKPARDLVLGALLGLLVALGIVFLLESLDDRLRGSAEVEALTGAPALGSIPFDRELSGSVASTMVHESTSPVAEAHRTLRTNLRYLSVERPLRTLLVTSSVKGEGKSTTSANLAASFAIAGVRTTLISADLRRPSVHKLFGFSNNEGLVDAVLPNARPDLLIQSNELPGLRFLAAGPVPPNPAEILSSSRFVDLLARLSADADLVIIDSPPLLGVADASALAVQVDGVVLVVNPEEVDRRTLAHAVDQLHKAGGRLLGTVLNSVSPSLGYGYNYGYYDYYYEDDSRAGSRERGPLAGLLGKLGAKPGKKHSPRARRPGPEHGAPPARRPPAAPVVHPAIPGGTDGGSPVESSNGFGPPEGHAAPEPAPDLGPDEAAPSEANVAAPSGVGNEPGH